MKLKQLFLVLSSVGLTLSTLNASAGEIVLGVAQALTGPASKYGVPIRNGITLAVDEINAKGGINGNKLKIVAEDEQGKKEEAINVYKKLITRDKVIAIIGPTLSNSAFAANPIANAMKTVVFGTSNTANGITDIGPYSFRNSIMEADVTPPLLKTAIQKYGVKKVAILYGNDDAFTKNGYDVFASELKKQGIQILGTETFAKGDVDFRAQLTKIKAKNPDAIVCSALAEEAGNILLQARQLGLKQLVIAGNGFNSPKIFEIAKTSAENVLIGSPWAIDNPSAINKAFVANYAKRFNTKADQFSAQAYDSVYIIGEALKKAKLTNNIVQDREALRTNLINVKYNGVTGAFNFRKTPNKANGGYDAQQNAFIFISKGGQFTSIK